ncbi:MAG: hypothetical protein AAF487_02140 [Bacteroidota bacterium]
MKINLLVTSLTFIFILSYSAKEIYFSESFENTTVQESDLMKKFDLDIRNYLDAFNKGKWNEVMEMIYPKLFDFITRDQMTQAFNQMEDMGMELKTDFNKIERISGLTEAEGKEFCRVYYDSDISVKISGNMLDAKDQLTQGFVEIYGKENVKYVGDKKTFNIKAKKSMIAISEKNFNDWSYIKYNVSQEELLKQLIPEKALEQILKG